jgi:hypothetical protein
MVVFDLLINLVATGQSGSSMSGSIGAAEARRLRRVWRRFIEAHRSELQSGRRFEIGGPDLPASLLPQGYHFSLPDGRQFPP